MLRGGDVDRVRLEEEFHGMERMAREELDREGLRQFLLAGQRQGRGKEAEKRLRRAGIRLEAREAWFCELDAGALERWGSS